MLITGNISEIPSVLLSNSYKKGLLHYIIDDPNRDDIFKKLDKIGFENIKNIIVMCNDVCIENIYKMAHTYEKNLSSSYHGYLIMKMNWLFISKNEEAWWPFIDKFEDVYKGLCVDFIHYLSTVMNFTYIIRYPQDGQWGAFNSTNGKWSGLAGQLQHKEVDVVIAPFSRTLARDKIIDFTADFYEDSFSIIYKKDTKSLDKSLLFIKPFRTNVWLIFFSVIPIISTVLLLVDIAWFSYSCKKLIFYQWLSNNMSVFGTAMLQAIFTLPRTESGRIVIGSCWIFMIIMRTTYSGNIVAFLTVSKDTPPFRNLYDLTQTDSFLLGTLGGAATVTEWNTSNTKFHKSVWAKVTDSLEKNSKVLSINFNEHMDLVKQGGYAFYLDSTSFALETAKDSRLSTATNMEPFYAHYAVALPKHSFYSETFRKYTVLVKETGLIKKWKNKWWPAELKNPEITINKQIKPVTLVNMQGVIYVWASLIG
ncbi:DgyrCDS25 [Dimorphilus gyrociliatus]|uniref:DgyrCDS25 n=1 Tax=Dimorphilus gyrociliatus TaxID=2664684 RepID=A0A7I8V636_9ANNE|nr:DgyrCDS25 [Dimorphilus gyrociliatus]